MATTDWWRTTRQAIPQLGRLIWKLRPTLELESIREIDSAFVDRHGVKTLLWDVDGTLMGHHDPALPPELLEVIRRLLTVPGLEHAILSNCGEERFEELGRIFPEIPVFKAYQTAEGVALRRLLRGDETWRGHEGAAMGAKPVCGNPLKKPSAELISGVLATLGRPPSDAVFMVGDQYFTDIAGANLAGVNSIKVATIAPHTFPLLLRSFQRAEWVMVRLLGQRRPTRPHSQPER
jgi:predicted HAD superfamily phosphohydrolase YqeG